MKTTFKDLRERQLSDKLAAAADLRHLTRPPRGWLHTIRTSLGMPQTFLAERLGVSQSSIVSYERSEAEGSIQMTTLRRVAEAMDCDLVYAVVPRASLEQTRFKQAQRVAWRTVRSVAETMALEDQALPQSDMERRVNDLAKTLLVDHPRAIWNH